MGGAAAGMGVGQAVVVAVGNRRPGLRSRGGYLGGGGAGIFVLFGLKDQRRNQKHLRHGHNNARNRARDQAGCQ